MSKGSAPRKYDKKLAKQYKDNKFWDKKKPESLEYIKSNN